jgi:DNA-binding transcriptional MerR regulator
LDHKAPDAFRTISEVADELDLPQHVLRFWESRFHDIKPMKRGGGRRYYRPDDVDLLRGIRHLLYGEGYTIRGVQRILREQGARFVQAVWQEGAPQPPHGASEDEEFSVAAPGEVEVLDDERGLRGRLSSLLGRDLGDRRDDVETRREPPLNAAPVPRVEADDRATHGMQAPEPKAAASAADLRSGLAANVVANPESVAPPLRQALPSQALPRENLHKLHAALHELAECRKLIDAAVARAP